MERLAYLKRVRLLFLQSHTPTQGQPKNQQQGAAAAAAAAATVGPAAAATAAAAAGGGTGGGVDDGGLLLYLLACLKDGLLLDLDADVVTALDGVLSGELPRAKGWRRLRAQVAALARNPDVRWCFVFGGGG